MRISRLWLPLVLVAWTSTGCGGSDPYEPPADDDDADVVSCMDALEADVQAIDEAEEVVVDWSQLTEDLDGDPVDPAADIDQLVVTFLDQTVEEAAERLCTGALEQSDVVLIVEDNTVQGSTLAELDATGTAGTVAAVQVLGGGTVRGMAIAEVLAGLVNTGILVTN